MYLTREEFFHNAWRWICGLPDKKFYWECDFSYEEIRALQWDDEFEEYCRNRMIMGAFRYGTLPTNRDKDSSHLFQSIKDRLDLFLKTHDLELLVDIANFARVGFYNCKDKKDYTFGKVDTEKVKWQR